MTHRALLGLALASLVPLACKSGAPEAVPCEMGYAPEDSPCAVVGEICGGECLEMEFCGGCSWYECGEDHRWGFAEALSSCGTSTSPTTTGASTASSTSTTSTTTTATTTEPATDGSTVDPSTGAGSEGGTTTGTTGTTGGTTGGDSSLSLDPATLTFFELPIGSLRYAVAGFDPEHEICASIIFFGDIETQQCDNFQVGDQTGFPYVFITPNAAPPCMDWDYAGNVTLDAATGCVQLTSLNPLTIAIDMSLTVSGVPFTGTITVASP